VPGFQGLFGVPRAGQHDDGISKIVEWNYFPASNDQGFFETS
jgi:hypothetical protein